MEEKKELTEEYIQSRGQSIFRSSSNWVSENITQRWKDSNDLYDGKFKRKQGEKPQSDVLLGQGRLFIPKTYSHVQRILVDLLDAYFSYPDEIVEVASWKNIPIETREIVKSLLCYRLNSHPINFYQESYEACLDALKNKVGIFKVYPNIKTKTIQVPIPQPLPPMSMDVPRGTMPMAEPQQMFQEQEVIESFNPVIDCLPYEDVFFDARATWKDYWKYPVVHRMRKNIDYLKRRGYKNLDDLKPAQTIDGTDEIKIQRNKENSSPFTLSSDVEVVNQDEVYIYEIWDFLDVNNDGLLESCSYILAGDEAGPTRLIRDVQDNTLPYKIEGEDYNRSPIVMGQAFPEPHQLLGKDMPEITEGLQRETNAIRNQRREAVALALRKPILVNRGANIDLVSLMNRRIGGVVQGDDISPSSVREMEVSDPTSSSMQESNRVDQDFYEVTSIPPDLMGMPSSNQTATGVTAHISNANKKISQIIRNLSYTLFLPTFKMLLQLEQEYENDAFIEMVTGRVLGWQVAKDGMPAKEIIQGDFDLYVNMGVNKQTQINKWMMLFDRGVAANQATVGMLQAGVVNPAETHFVNVMKFFHKMLPLVGERAVEEFMLGALPAIQPEAGHKGVASQPVLPEQLGAEMLSQNPGGY
ncbi:MAG: hypothetical protein Q8O68_00945 [Candidatus Daviesbacteria bacterium]|nr:hypothetical protein [Candidatus Daviesbacteria bacterium]